MVRTNQTMSTSGSVTSVAVVIVIIAGDFLQPTEVARRRKTARELWDKAPKADEIYRQFSVD